MIFDCTPIFVQWQNWAIKIKGELLSFLFSESYGLLLYQITRSASLFSFCDLFSISSCLYASQSQCFCNQLYLCILNLFSLCLGFSFFLSLSPIFFSMCIYLSLQLICSSFSCTSLSIYIYFFFPPPFQLSLPHSPQLTHSQHFIDSLQHTAAAAAAAVVIVV